MSNQKLLEVNQVSKSFKNIDKEDLLVIDQVNFALQEGEIIALLGQSGSGKSTLLRIISGLIPSSSGEVIYRGQHIKGPAPGISMVFQSFALMPWLTVLENVELGLEALRIPRKERRKKALAAIDMIGMDGFENAYPKELSGGMRQRVGFARALVVSPDLLLMDEPFSALDVLTAEHLRNDLIGLWQEDHLTQGIILVTHNIEEAVLMADRIMIFGSNPGYISGELKIDLEHPRQSQDPQVLKLIDQVYTMMTTVKTQRMQKNEQTIETLDIAYRLPEANISELIGLLEQVDELKQKGPIDLPDIADAVRLDIDDLFPILEALSILQLAKVQEGDISMTEQGRQLIAADITDKKIIFAKVLKEKIPLAKHITLALETQHNHRLSEERILNELEDHFTPDEAERVLNTMIDWGRYAEIFAYDFNTKTLSLEDVE